MNSASPGEWPRSALFTLPLFAIVASVVAIGLARPPSVLLAAMAGAAMGGGSAVFIRHRRTRRMYTPMLQLGVVLVSLLTGFVLAGLAIWADGILQRVAGVALAGAI